MTLLLVNAASSLYCLGVAWFVQVVHYPLFVAVGEDGWPAYHAAHTTRTGWVIAGPMLVQLAAAATLAFAAPAGIGALAVWTGLALTLAIFALTFVGAVPVHARLAARFDAPAGRRLIHLNGWRTAAWSAHAALAVGMLAAAG